MTIVFQWTFTKKSPNVISYRTLQLLSMISELHDVLVHSFFNSQEDYIIHKESKKPISIGQ